MVLGLVQIKFAGYAKVIANLVFVVGSFVALAVADVLAESLLLDIYVLGLIGFLLWLRILLSTEQQTNLRIMPSMLSLAASFVFSSSVEGAC